jgi:DNA-binding protein H-NS
VACWAIVCAVPAVRADEAAPPERAAASEAGRLLRAGMQVLRAALPDEASAAQTADPKEAKEAKDGKQRQQQAAEKQRQQQIAQQAQQMQQFFQPVLQAELELVRKTCGGLPVEARKKIMAAGTEAVKAVAKQFAEHQFAGRGRQGFDARKTIHEAVAAAVKPHAAVEEFAAYEREQAARIARRARAARILIVNKVDSELELSQSQREKIEGDLEKHWEAGWLRELDDNGGIMINNQRPAPDFADPCVAPHLDDRQKAEWKKWCQQAGWNRTGHHVGWNFDGQSLQPDPWWSR